MAAAARLEAGAAPAMDPQERSAVVWMRSAVQAFTEAEPTTAELERLLPLLDGARVVGVGEATHGDHEDQAFKAALIKELVRSGRIQVLALECNRTAGEGFDDYVREGRGEVVDLMRSRGFFRTWQDDEFAGLIVWLRAWNQTAAKPVRIVGTDMQDSPRDAAAALDFVRAQDPALAERLATGLGALSRPETLKARFYEWTLSTPPDDYAKIQAGAQALEQAFDDHAASWSDRPGWDRARRAAALAVKGLELFELEAGRPNIDLATLPTEYETRRDRWMADNLLSALAANENAALWAHDGHVMGALPTALAASGQTTEGAVLRATLGNAYRAIGFAWSRGAFNAPTLGGLTGAGLANRTDFQPQILADDLPGDLGFVLDHVGPDHFWIDLRAIPPAQVEFAGRLYYRGWAGAGVVPAKWQTDRSDRLPLTPGFDVLVYFRTITPSHQWPKPR
jgi:erythromycin esterase